jgi:ferrous iron transport protein B
MDRPSISVEVEQAKQEERERLLAPPRIHAVALVGPPNCGKSTLFNRLTNLRQKIANYPGVTVEYRIGKLSKANGISLIDLPGIRGAAAGSEDEQVAWGVLRGELPGLSKPDAILLILDGTNLRAQLPLASAVLALGLRTVVLVNMADTLLARGGSVDIQALQESLGVPVALISATKGTGLEAIERFLTGTSPVEPPSLPPILQGAAQRHSWAKAIAARAKYRVPKESLWTKRLDSFFLHPLFGPLFLLISTVLVFQGVFVVGQFLSNAIDAGLRFAGEAIRPEITNPILQSLVLDGLWKGMGSVLVFLPPILMLFLSMGLMEDSGYLARAAVISDRTMAKIGLNGKSFIPLLAGYGCAVPAIMATRIVGSRRDRLATIFVIPFMTCSARLPVYTLLIAAFIPARPLLGGLVGLRACVLLSLYALGFFAAVTTAKLLNSTILERSKIPFVLELPEYRLPSAKSLAMLLFERARIFLTQVGTVVLGVSFVIWLLTHLPLHAGRMSGLDESFLARAGQWIEPVLRPLGFNWKIGVGLLSSFVAREVMVGTLGTIYGADPVSHSTGLATALQRDLSFPGAMALLAFFALAMQCTSTFATVKRETNSWKWPALQFVYMGGLAYAVAWVINQCLSNWF